MLGFGASCHRYLAALVVLCLVAGGAGILLASNEASGNDSTAADRSAVLELIHRHQVLIDERDAEAYAALFTVDGVLDAWYTHAEGTEQLAQSLDEYHLSGFTVHTRHMGGPATISINGSSATALSHWWIVDTLKPISIVATGTYRDVFRRTSDGWKIAQRQVATDQPPPLTRQ